MTTAKFISLSFTSSRNFNLKSDHCRTATYFKDKEEPIQTEESASDVDDKTGVNIIRHGDKLIALTESCVLQEIDPDTLSRKSNVSGSWF